MKKKNYGNIYYNKDKNNWIIEKLDPHVSLKMKQLFKKIPSHKTPPFNLPNNMDMCADIKWFMSRYPFKISESDLKLLKSQEKGFFTQQENIEKVYLPSWVPEENFKLKEGQLLRIHQSVAIEVGHQAKKLLLVDAIGTGKSYTAIGSALKEGSLPAAFVVQTHLPKQFEEKIESFCHLKTHIIKTKTPYKLPVADIYIFKYSLIAGWTDIFEQNFFKFAMFDEIQELRHGTSTAKGYAANILTQNVDKVLGTTATPIYGYGLEMFHVMEFIKSGCLGTKNEFMIEWCGGYDNKIVKDPKSLGSYLRESQLMLRRTKKDIYGEQIEPNIIIENVEYDEKSVKSVEELAKKLAITTLTGSFTERGQAARTLDMKLREATGISKAKSVAFFVKLLVESGEKVLLSGWHREVYDIWNEELKDLNVVMYTGSESSLQKEKNKNEFVNGKANVMIISHTSGAGLDGLQSVCSSVVIGELAWSKEVHNQIIGRVDRDGQKDPVSAFIMYTEYGSDPVIMDMLGLKSNQTKGITDPTEKFTKVNNDRGRLTILAEKYLESKNIKVN